MTRALRIAILAHSTNPRGGVVHALELGDALVRLGHQAVVHAPDAAGHGFFRPTLCRAVALPATPVAAGDTFGLVEARVADYLRHFEAAEAREFDIFHAQDGISGNALATMRTRGLIDGFLRTVHHIDDFADPRVEAQQRRSILEAAAHAVVSPLWRRLLRESFDLEAAVVGNGVDLARFTPRPEPKDLILRRDLGLASGPVFLSVGGVEERKNSIRILEAFAQVHTVRPSAQLVIAGGASLLDHDAYQTRFAEALRASTLPRHAVRRVGPVADLDMPALYRNADVLVFPSLKEGFGLAVLEAMACGLPVVTSGTPPFTDYLGDNDALWCTPDSVTSIADAMMLALHPALKRGLSDRGCAVAARHDWQDVARAYLRLYEKMRARAHA